MARVQLQFRRITSLICNMRLSTRAMSGSNKCEGLSTAYLEPRSLGQHCPRFSLLQQQHISQKPASYPSILWSAHTRHKNLKVLERSPLYDPFVLNTSIIGDMIEMEHIGDHFDEKNEEIHASSVLKKRKKKMNKHKYKKRRKLDKFKRRNLENIKERKRRVKEKAAARKRL